MADATILIVDDEEELAENLADLLEFEGYKVVMYFSGEEAVEKIDAVKADLALLDYQLPGMSGLDVLTSLKEKRPGLPVFIVSASSQPNTRDEAMKLGADGFILKPYNQDDLLEAIRNALSSVGS